MLAPGTDAGLDPEPHDGVEEGDEEYDRGRKPEVCVESSQQREEECQTPEGGFDLEAA